METGDPDDVMTLCFLISHPQICVRAVTIMLGTDEQVGLVKSILQQANISIPVGSFAPDSPKKVVSPFYYKWLGTFTPQKPDNEGFVIIQKALLEFPDLQILTGAPMRNFNKITDSIICERWVAQGGFAGDNVVPENYRLEKFKGKITCPTFNFNGDPKTALALLSNPNIQRKMLISKNVCHGVVYDWEMHQAFAKVENKNLGLHLIYKGMEKYLEFHPEGKKFHDPLAACVLVDESVCEFREVNVFRSKGEWGSELAENTQTFISVKADKQRMVEILTTYS